MSNWVGVKHLPVFFARCFGKGTDSTHGAWIIGFVNHTVDGRNPANQLIWYIPGGAGFLPSTVSLGIQSPSQMMIGVSNHLLSIVFRFHYHSQKVIGSLGYVHDFWKCNSCEAVMTEAASDDAFPHMPHTQLILSPMSSRIITKKTRNRQTSKNTWPIFIFKSSRSRVATDFCSCNPLQPKLVNASTCGKVWFCFVHLRGTFKRWWMGHFHGIRMEYPWFKGGTKIQVDRT